MGTGQWWSPLPTAGQSWPQPRERAGVSPRACLQGQRVWGGGVRWEGGFLRGPWSRGLWCSGPFASWDLLPTDPDWLLSHITQAGATDGLPTLSPEGFRVRVPGHPGPARLPTWALQPLPQPPFIILFSCKFFSAHQIGKQSEGLVVTGSEETVRKQACPMKTAGRTGPACP